MQEFQEKIQSYMIENAVFARSYAQGVETLMNKALKPYKWHKVKFDDLHPVLKELIEA